MCSPGSAPKRQWARHGQRGDAARIPSPARHLRPALLLCRTASRRLDREALQGFVSWLIAYRGERGRLSDRSIRNAVAPLRLCLLGAADEGLVERDVPCGLLLPHRRGGHGWDFEQGRFLTRTQLGRLLADDWRPFFDLLASTGLRISEAIALRWRDLELEEPAHLWVRRSIVRGVVGAPKSRFGRRCIPIDQELARRLEARRDPVSGEEAFVFPNHKGAPLNPSNIRYRILVSATKRRRSSPGRLSRPSPYLCVHAGRARSLAVAPATLDGSYTLDVYGHLIDVELAPALDLGSELLGQAPQSFGGDAVDWAAS